MNSLSSCKNNKQRNRKKIKQDIISKERMDRIMRMLSWEDEKDEYRYISSQEKKDYALWLILENSNKVNQLMNRNK